MLKVWPYSLSESSFASAQKKTHTHALTHRHRWAHLEASPQPHTPPCPSCDPYRPLRKFLWCCWQSPVHTAPSSSGPFRPETGPLLCLHMDWMSDHGATSSWWLLWRKMVHSNNAAQMSFVFWCIIHQRSFVASWTYRVSSCFCLSCVNMKVALIRFRHEGIFLAANEWLIWLGHSWCCWMGNVILSLPPHWNTQTCY